MKALVLAGGCGTRLRPFTYTIPKALLPVANRPILYYVLDSLVRSGLQDIGVIVSPQTAERVGEALAGYPGRARFTMLRQERPLGLAHAIMVARDFLGEQPFVMHLGDNVVSHRIDRIAVELQEQRADAVLLLKEVEDPQPFGVAVMDDQGRLVRLVEKPKTFLSSLALVGVYGFSAAIHDAVLHLQPSWRGELEITDAIQTLLDQGARVVSSKLDGWWLDCGKKDDVLEANRRVLEEYLEPALLGSVDQRSQIQGPVLIGQGARVESAQLVGPCVIGQESVVRASTIGPYASIGRGCRIVGSSISRCVIMDGARIEGVQQLEDSVVGQQALLQRVEELPQIIRCMIGDHAEVRC